MATKIFFTGGGTAGHVTPNIALIEKLQAEGWQAHYVGSADGIERSLIAPLNLPYHQIATGKLRRYFSWQNFIDPFRILWGILQSLVLCLRERPDVVFSKGGFVAVPIVFAAWLCRIPVICHESDMTPGLANKLCFPFARRVCVNFPETEKYLPHGKTVVTGSPVRQSLLSGDPEKGRAFLGFTDEKPILLVFGGSLGAEVINRTLRKILPELLPDMNVCHITGAGHLEVDLATPGYFQAEYLREEFGDVLAASDLAVSRAGANSVYELLLTQTPHLLIPLSAAASRGDQIINARVFAERGMSLVLPEQDLTSETLKTNIKQALSKSSELREAMAAFPRGDAVVTITDLIKAQL